MTYKIKEDKEFKILRSSNYNYLFRKSDGYFIRTGVNFEDDPTHSPYGPEIIDMEISTVCHQGCSFCYKTNTAEGKNMSFETFKKIFDKLPDTVTQIAFGIGDIDGNPDLWKIMEYSRENGVIPNITINGRKLDDDQATRLSTLCGAVAVSHYNSNDCFNAVQKLNEYKKYPGANLRQVNIHQLLSEDTWDECMDLLHQAKMDPRLHELNAIVFLWLKPKGERNTFKEVKPEQYSALIKKALELEVPIGFDSCSAPMFMKEVENSEKKEQFKMMAESCESTLFSYYINVDGIGYPCSFTEDHKDWKGIDVLNCTDFIDEVWNNRETQWFRAGCIASKDHNECRKCIAYKLGG